MARRAAALNPPCPRCGHHPTVANGHSRGHRRYRCPGCQHSFGTTTGTVMARLKTPAPEVARALRVVVHRGSLRAAEAVTGHKYKTIHLVTARRSAGRRSHRGASAGPALGRGGSGRVLVICASQRGGDAPNPGAVTGESCTTPVDGGGGERWGCLVRSRTSRFVVAWAAGTRTAALAEAVVGSNACADRRTGGDRLGERWVDGVSGCNLGGVHRCGPTDQRSSRSDRAAAGGRGATDPRREAPPRSAAGTGGGADTIRDRSGTARYGAHRTAHWGAP